MHAYPGDIINDSDESRMRNKVVKLEENTYIKKSGRQTHNTLWKIHRRRLGQKDRRKG